VISSDGKQLGVMPLREGLRLAAERNMDLVEVAPTARPPVCRIMDYGKYRYEQSKRDREAKKRQKVISVKEVRMSPKIDEHDFQVKARNAERFLKDGDKVKVSVRFRGREIVHSKLADKRLGELAGRVQDYGVIESPPRLEGRHMVMILAPKQD
jgi:translation initiation factor IF-3